MPCCIGDDIAPAAVDLQPVVSKSDRFLATQAAGLNQAVGYQPSKNR
jgi:hypothetical protein